jgi:signal peptide peptidase SppA
MIEAVTGRPWAIHADVVQHLRGFLSRDGIAGLRHLAELKADVHATDGRSDAWKPRTLEYAVAAELAFAPGAASSSPAIGASSSAPSRVVGVVPIIGTLTQRRQAIGSVGETRSTAEVARDVQAMAANPGIDAILLEVDSLGGEVFGVPEAFAAIREATRAKPIIALANSRAASAALYLASAASEVLVTPSGVVGSVGVYALHVDASKAIEASGEAWEFIIADKSPYKVEGSPAGPLTAAARAHAQAEVDRYMGLFVRDLARGRGVSERHVLSEFGGGRMLSPVDALEAGMVDGVATFDEALRRAATLARPPAGRSSGRRAEAASSSAPGASAEAVELAARAALARLPRGGA